MVIKNYSSSSLIKNFKLAQVRSSSVFEIVPKITVSSKLEFNQKFKFY